MAVILEEIIMDDEDVYDIERKYYLHKSSQNALGYLDPAVHSEDMISKISDKYDERFIEYNRAFEKYVRKYTGDKYLFRNNVTQQILFHDKKMIVYIEDGDNNTHCSCK